MFADASRTPIFDRLCAQRSMQPTFRLDYQRLATTWVESAKANLAKTGKPWVFDRQTFHRDLMNALDLMADGGSR